MKVRLLISLTVFLALCSISLFAQSGANPLEPGESSEPIYIGPIGGVNVTMHDVNLASFAWDAACPEFKTGTGLGFFGGLSIEYLLGETRTSTSSIIARFMFNTMPGNFKEDGDFYPSLMPGDTIPVNSVTEHSLDVSYNLLSLDLLYKIKPIPGMGFGIVAGPTFDFAMTKTMLQKYSIIEPNYIKFKKLTPEEQAALGISIVRYEDTDRTIVVRDGNIAEAIRGNKDDALAMRVGLKIGAQYEINLKGFIVVPNIMYNYALTKLTSKDNWHVNVLQVGIDVRFALVIF